MHYLDNFLLIGQAGSGECGQALSMSLQICERLGVPIAQHKMEGPSSVISFLRIRIDTVNMMLSLPQEKLTCLRALIGRDVDLVARGSYCLLSGSFSMLAR